MMHLSVYVCVCVCDCVLVYVCTEIINDNKFSKIYKLC